MRTKRININRAFEIAIIALIVFTFLQFVDGEILYIIGNTIEKLLHIHTEINVETMRSYLVMIFSGIFASTIVALSFFIVEYQYEKQKAFMNLIKENTRLSNLYLEIPYFDDKSEYGKLCINYYHEVLGELIAGKRDKKKPYIIVSGSLKEETIKNTHEAKLIRYLEQNKELLTSVFVDGELPINQKLKDIFIEIQFKLIEALEVYNLIVKEDLEVLKYYVYDIERFSGLSFRKIKKVIGEDKEVLQGLTRANIFNKDIVEKRILTLHKRVTEKTKLNFEEVNLDSVNNKDYIDDFEACITLFNKVLFAQNGIFGEVYHEYFKANVIYNKFAYHMAKLNSILVYNLTREIDEINKWKFTSRRKKEVRGGRVLHNKWIPGDVMYGDIYRE
ncbi:hypothetical protein [Bacillus sp. MUM 13]|uniref:hypothetical protein n=1 Tax=Bacillus sp. MUM 13 TaxID=1678001 RepID=UPI0008F5A60D|nr:hypothetical protein [Bacillus sp. MUM 13]OIK09926.1 hypothetical protein BIV59_15840 [Bacillus sp. MUM 13]